MTPATSQPLPSSATAREFTDGFGRRTRVADPTGEPIDVLRLDAALAGAPGFDFALRERVNRLANFRHAYYSRVRRVDRPDSATLAVVSEALEGARLSRILEVSNHFDLELDVNAALCLLRQIVPAVAMLHQNARDVSHGALAPERIVITPSARVVLVEYVLGAAVESLGFSRERLWMDLRVAVPPGAGVVRMNHRADVMQIGVVALALVLGRPLVDTDLRDLSALLAAATETTSLGGRQPISESLRRWLARALQLDPRGSFESALEAQLALDDVLSGDAGYAAAPVALESFLARYDDHVDRMPEASAAAPVAPREVAFVEAVAVEADAHAEAEEDNEEEEDDPLAFTRVSVPRPPPSLGVVKVSADAPPVPSFRAAPTPPVAPAQVEPAPVPVIESIPAVSLQPEPAAAAEPGEAVFDEESLRAQFLAASGGAKAASPAIAGWWRIAALALALVALGQGGFIWWRLAGSPSGLLGANGTLKVESKPMGAQVRVDGEVRGVTPLSVSLKDGAHVLEIAAGGEPRVIPIAITAGQTLAQYVELVGIQTLGRLSIQSAPAGATVLVDGQPRGKTPLEVPDVPAGEHELVLDLNGQRIRHSVTVSTGITTTVDLPMAAVEAAGMFPAPAPTTGTLLVQAPFEMQIFEAGAALGSTGARLAMPPGPHALEIVSDTLGFKITANVEIVAGKTARVPVSLPKGTAHLNATPWAEVWVDGEKVGDTPLGNLPLTVGPHEIVFKHPELGERSHAATVRVGEALRLSVDFTAQR